MDMENAGEPTGEARVVQNLREKRKSKSKDFDPITYPKITKNIVGRKGENQLALCWWYWK
jgi:hypothetical protein